MPRSYMNEDRFEELERRVSKLEKEVFQEKKYKKETKHTGLRGGLRLLIGNGFFNYPKALNEIVTELKREGYHYPNPSISKALSVDLTLKQKLLNRIKEEKSWKYVLRK
ncbi:hypothetical protein NKOR_02385 [Candidatus Nitrosopumilus koreensis AR1]|uniref:Uncharacterized protein n=1 Tax=Candidatus Nitrosopumilus koreensis AR1 TaxID=1229908 RepID=K0B618_9ARCH|nr:MULTISPECIES: hypothetical protein [Nitrosopumilus]AFS80375.1 hypothetical protein NKOR_02385 [Candidatus Nitrosopumilus koreensis AR1]